MTNATPHIATPLVVADVFYAVLNEATNTLLAPTFNDREAAERFRLLHAMPLSCVVAVTRDIEDDDG